MSYTAKGTGDIYFLLLREESKRGLHSILFSKQVPAPEQDCTGDPAVWLKEGLSDAGFSNLDCKEINAPGLYHVALAYQGNYEEYQTLELLDAMAPFTAEGCIAYVGEDGALWRFLFLNDSWIEQYGEIRYSTPSSGTSVRCIS